MLLAIAAALDGVATREPASPAALEAAAAALAATLRAPPAASSTQQFAAALNRCLWRRAGEVAAWARAGVREGRVAAVAAAPLCRAVAGAVQAVCAEATGAQRVRDRLVKQAGQLFYREINADAGAPLTRSACSPPGCACVRTPG
jgi:hypothetical protein